MTNKQRREKVYQLLRFHNFLFFRDYAKGRVHVKIWSTGKADQATRAYVFGELEKLNVKLKYYAKSEWPGWRFILQ